MCQVNGSLLVAPSFPPAGPGQPGSPPSSVLWGCYDFPLARTCSLMVSVAGPTCTSCVRGRRGAPGGFGGNPSGLEHLISRRSLTGVLHTWTHAGSRRFPGDPFHAFALLQDPGRADKTSPMAVLPAPPPAYPNRRPQRVHNLEANTGLQHPLSTLHERRHRLPCKTRFRLAGCAFTGRGSNPLDRFERFQVTSHSPFQDFACRKGGLCQAALRWP
jgi:hypothetical protein